MIATLLISLQLFSLATSTKSAAFTLTTHPRQYSFVGLKSSYAITKQHHTFLEEQVADLSNEAQKQPQEFTPQCLCSVLHRGSIAEDNKSLTLHQQPTPRLGLLLKSVVLLAFEFFFLRTRHLFQKQNFQHQADVPSHDPELTKGLFELRHGPSTGSKLTDAEMRHKLSKVVATAFAKEFIRHIIVQEDDYCQLIIQIFTTAVGHHNYRIKISSSAGPIQRFREILSFLRKVQEMTMSFERVTDEILLGKCIKNRGAIRLSKIHSSMDISKDMYDRTVEVMMSATCKLFVGRHRELESTTTQHADFERLRLLIGESFVGLVKQS